MRPTRACSIVQGWLPKPGLQYGGHFVLYDGHPEDSHSSTIVRWAGHEACAGSDVPRMDWQDTMATLRVAGTVRKKLKVLLMRIAPDAACSSPDCLSKIEVLHHGNVLTLTGPSVYSSVSNLTAHMQR